MAQVKKTEVAQFPVKWDDPPHGVCYVMVGIDTATQLRKVWIDCARTANPKNYISFRPDEIQPLIDALAKAKAALG